MTTKPTISKAELISILVEANIDTNLVTVHKLEALIADQQRQLLDRLEAELGFDNDGYGAVATDFIQKVIKDIREGLS